MILVIVAEPSHKKHQNIIQLIHKSIWTLTRSLNTTKGSQNFIEKSVILGSYIPKLIIAKQLNFKQHLQAIWHVGVENLGLEGENGRGNWLLGIH